MLVDLLNGITYKNVYIHIYLYNFIWKMKKYKTYRNNIYRKYLYKIIWYIK